MWTAVDEYFSDLIVPQDGALLGALKRSVEAGLPEIQVTPNQGKLLMLLAQIQGARKVLEVGSLGGYSTIWLARGMSAGGSLVSLELEPAHAEVARKNVAQAGLRSVVEIRVGPALENLPMLESEGVGPFDLIFIDADKPNNPGYWEWAMKLSRPGSVIIVDNVVRNGAVADAESLDPSILGVHEMVDLVSKESRVSATAIQTVGSKGYDGFLIARVL